MGDDMSPPKKMKKASVVGSSVKCNSEVSSFISSIAAKREKVWQGDDFALIKL